MKYIKYNKINLEYVIYYKYCPPRPIHMLAFMESLGWQTSAARPGSGS